MKSRRTANSQPTARDIQALVAYLPKLYRHGLTPITQWLTETEDGVLILPWPEYDERVVRFIDLIESQGCWLCDYDPEETERMLMDKAGVGNATIPEIRRMLTLVVRGERFCSGWWSSMIEDGHVRRLLQRLAEIERAGMVENHEGRRL